MFQPNPLKIKVVILERSETKILTPDHMTSTKKSLKCQLLKKMTNTLDGGNCAPVIGSLSHHLQGFYMSGDAGFLPSTVAMEITCIRNHCGLSSQPCQIARGYSLAKKLTLHI